MTKLIEMRYYEINMKIRKLRKEDIEEAKSLISLCYKSRAPLHILEKGKTIVCIQSEQVVGVASFWRNELHNRTVVEEICVLPKLKRQGIGSKLHNELIKIYPLNINDFALDALCFNDNIEAIKFLNHLGYKKYLESYSNIMSIESVNLIESPKQIVPLNELYGDKGMIEKVKQFHMRRYDEDHEPYLPLTKDKEIRNDYYHGGNPEFGAAIFDDSKMVGCSLAFINFEERLEENVEDTTCLHGYATGNSLEDEVLNIQAMYSYQAMLLKRSGHKNIYIEFDSIERTAPHMLSWIPRRERILERYQLKL